MLLHFTKRMLLALLGSNLFLLTLTSCADVPDEVKNDMSSYHDAEGEKSDNAEFEYVEVGALGDEVATALSKDYGQFTISDKVNFVPPDEINIMSFSDLSDFSGEIEKAKALFPENSAFPSESAENDLLYYYMNDMEKRYFAVGNDGFISMLDPYSFDISYSYNQPVVKIYHPNRKDDLSDEYQLKDGKCSVSDAVDYINDWMKTKYKPLASDYDYQVNTVIVRKYNENYLYQFLVEALYKGVPIDSYTREAELINGQLTNKMAYVDYGIQIQMLNTCSINSFTNLTGIYLPKVVENVDKCVSLESALNLCKSTFSDFKNVVFSDIRIKYTLMPIYETDENGEPVIVGYDSRPVWEIVIDVPPEEFLPKNKENTYGDVRKYIYIDAVTGEIKYNLEVMKME